MAASLQLVSTRSHMAQDYKLHHFAVQGCDLPNALSLDIAAATQDTARVLMPLSAKGDKFKADELAVQNLRQQLDTLPYSFRVVVGEGAKDKAPQLYEGEVLGRLKPQNIASFPNTSHFCFDLLVDPLECTGNFAYGLPDAMVAVLVAPVNGIAQVPGTYMEQIIVPPCLTTLLAEEKSLSEIRPSEFLRKAQQILAVDMAEICVVVQNRRRHADLIAEIRSVGAGVALIESGSISAAFELLYASNHRGRTHLLWGTYGAPEGIIGSFLARKAKAGFRGQIRPHDEQTQKQSKVLGLFGKELRPDDLVSPHSALVLSGVHSSTWLKGVETWITDTPDRKRKQRVYSVIIYQDRIETCMHEDAKLQQIKDYCCE